MPLVSLLVLESPLDSISYWVKNTAATLMLPSVMLVVFLGFSLLVLVPVPTLSFVSGLRSNPVPHCRQHQRMDAWVRLFARCEKFALRKIRRQKNPVSAKGAIAQCPPKYATYD
jgi:hypothetical protein